MTAKNCISEEERRKRNRAACKKWREAHPETRREWDRKNRENRRLQNRESYQRNAAERRARAIKYRQENKEKCAAYSRKWHEKNREKRLMRAVARNYGIPAEEYKAMLARQGGACAICGKAETVRDPRTGRVRNLCVDHDHTTGVVRGLLCKKCNSGLAYFGEDAAILNRAADYVKAARGSRQGQTCLSVKC